MQQITVFIDLQDQLNMFRTNICPSSGAWDCKLQHVVWCPVVMVGWRSGGRQPDRHLPSHQAHSTTLPPSWLPTHHYNRTPYHSRNVTLTTHRLLERLKIIGAIPLLPLYSLMACKGEILSRTGWMFLLKVYPDFKLWSSGMWLSVVW
jgi:hypothetical protein